MHGAHADSDCGAVGKRSVLYHKPWCASREDFVLLRLKKEAAEEGAFHVRWSALNYHRIILTVLNRNEVTRRPRSPPLLSSPLWNLLQCSRERFVPVCVSTGRQTRTATQAVSDPVQGVHVRPGRLGPGVLLPEGAHRQPEDLRAQVRYRQLHPQKVLPPKTSRLVLDPQVPLPGLET